MQEIELAHGAVRINIANHGEAIPRSDVRELVEEFKLNHQNANFRGNKLEAKIVISRASLPGRPWITFIGGIAEIGPAKGPAEAFIVMPPSMSLGEANGAKQAVALLLSALSLRQSGVFSPENFEEIRRRMAEQMAQNPEDSDPKAMVDALIREIEERDRRNPPSPPPSPEA